MGLTSCDCAPRAHPGGLDTSVLASDPLHSAGPAWGTLWGAVGAVAGVAALIAFLIQWRFGGPRRVLIYSLSGVAPFLSSQILGISQEIAVTVDGEAIADPYIASLRIDNRSRRDIRSSDFDREKPLEFDLRAGIIVAQPTSPASGLQEALIVDGTKLKLGPTLIHGREKLNLTLITEGYPNISRRDILVNVKIRSQEEQRQRYRPVRNTAVVIEWLGVLIAILGIWGSAATDRGAYGIFMATGLAMFLCGSGIEQWIKRLSREPLPSVKA